MKYAIIGLGDFGRALALKLARRGAEVIAVDTDMELVNDVKEDVSVAVKLDPTDEKELRSQAINEVDVLVAADEDNFEINELTVVLAKRMGIPRVISYASGPMRARILKLIGADEVIQPEEDAAERLAKQLLYPTLKNYFEFVEGCSITEIEVTKKLTGKTLAQLNLPKRYGVNLIAIRRKDNESKDGINLIPKWSDTLNEGDVVTFAGTDTGIERLLADIQ